MVNGVGEGVADGVLLGVTGELKGVAVRVSPTGIGVRIGLAQEVRNEKRVMSRKGRVTRDK
jgi:hypothetical protein